MLDRPIALYAKQDFVFRNTTYNFVDGKKILVVAPVRWGKTTLLAELARWLAARGKTVIFISSNLKNLQVDWHLKHAQINVQRQESFKTLTLKDAGMEFALSLTQGASADYCFSLHKHVRWLTSFEETVDRLLEFVKNNKSYSTNLVVLVDEVHGTVNKNSSNAQLNRIINKLDAHGVQVIASTATPHSNAGNPMWDRTINIPWLSDVLMPHELPNLTMSPSLLSWFHSIKREKHWNVDRFEIHPEFIDHVETIFSFSSWSLIPIVGQMFIDKFQDRIRQCIMKQWPTASALMINRGKYTFHHNLHGSADLTRNRDEKIGSVIQAVDEIFDGQHHALRDQMRLFTIGHNQMEEGQSHSNFSGDRFATGEFIIPNAGKPWDDKFAQWNRLEPIKASKYGITPHVVTPAAHWKANYDTTEYMMRKCEALGKGETFTEAWPDSKVLKPAAQKSGLIGVKQPTKASMEKLIACNTLHVVDYELSEECLNKEAGSRSNNPIIHHARRWIKKQTWCDRPKFTGRTIYPELYSKFVETEKTNRDDFLICERDKTSYYIMWFDTEYDHTTHKKITPRGEWAAPTLR
jgi:hypothetical protein